MWKAHGIWIAYWRLWNDSSHSGCVRKIKIINYKSPYLIPLERELEASVVILPSSVLPSPSSLLFSFQSPPFLLPHTVWLAFVLFFLFHYKPTFIISFFLLNYALSAIAIGLSFYVLRSPVWMDSRAWMSGLFLPSSCVPNLRHHAEMELSLKASCSSTRALLPSLHAQYIKPSPIRKCYYLYERQYDQ